MSESIRYPVIRHLKDDDNLLEKRDGGLLAGQESLAKEIAQSIHAELAKSDVSAILMATSPKKRAIQTAEMVASELRTQMKGIHVILKSTEALRDQYQGEVILPPDYKVGDSFEGLTLAGKIFREETFGTELGNAGTLTYAFGDPLLQPDGTYKYPELKKYFSRSGESYRDVLVRLFGALIELSQNIKRFQNKNVHPVVFTHSQARQIFKDLETAAIEYKRGVLKYETGTLGIVCWSMYKDRKGKGPDSSLIDHIDVKELLDEEIVHLLSREISYLQSL